MSDSQTVARQTMARAASPQFERPKQFGEKLLTQAAVTDAFAQLYGDDEDAAVELDVSDNNAVDHAAANSFLLTASRFEPAAVD